LFSISAGIRESLGDIVVKDIERTSPLRPRLLKLKVSNGKLSKKIGKLTSTQLPLLIYIYRLQRLKVLDFI